jgi:hypothetical protein
LLSGFGLPFVANSNFRAPNEVFRPCKRKHPRPFPALFRSSLRLADSNPFTSSQVIV